MSETEVNVYALDAAYKPFPTFEDWASSTTVDTVRWNRYNSSLGSRRQLAPDVLARAREIAKRAAAIDTGAIEGLYEVDRGFTYSVAFETTAWESALAQKGDQVKSLFEAQLHAYDYVLDLATKAEPISEAAVRKLHEVVCAAQSTYRVMTAIGPQEQALPKGQYKALPNHVRTRKGTDHSYAPVDVTPAEMARLMNEVRTEAFLAAHPVLQASYAHYAFVVIHPFADGNGRVARALASAFTYRAISMPIVIFSEQKNTYLDALEAGDAGDYQMFVDFILARSLDTIKLVDESVLSALSPSAGESIAAIGSLYVTKGGYTHEQVDQAGERLVEALSAEISRAISHLPAKKVSANCSIAKGTYTVSDPSYRAPLGLASFLQLALSTPAPAAAGVLVTYQVWLPRDAAGDDDILLKNAQTGEAFTARMDEVVPAISGVLQLRLGIHADRVVAQLLHQLKTKAEKAFGTRR
jgi:Fic family protein